jgi:hypothetical protein
MKTIFIFLTTCTILGCTSKELSTITKPTSTRYELTGDYVMNSNGQDCNISFRKDGTMTCDGYSGWSDWSQTGDVAHFGLGAEAIDWKIEWSHQGYVATLTPPDPRFVKHLRRR